MGEELFDYVFKQYAERWAFKHPKPADFFRTMEDASGIDLDWFWRGWYFTTDYVDVNIAKVEWFKVYTDQDGFENRVKATQDRLGEEADSKPTMDFSEGPKPMFVRDFPGEFIGDFRYKPDQEAIKAKADGKNVYEITFRNEGGLVMPLILEWTFTDGSKEREVIPAEVWRYNEYEIKKTFMKEKEVSSVQFDPQEELADVDKSNDVFPRIDYQSRFDKFKEGKN
jgi:hypothetical protein